HSGAYAPPVGSYAELVGRATETTWSGLSEQTTGVFVHAVRSFRTRRLTGVGGRVAADGLGSGFTSSVGWWLWSGSSTRVPRPRTAQVGGAAIVPEASWV